jgi:PAS domain-containing protein
VLVEAVGLGFVCAGVAIGMLPSGLRAGVELPAAVCVLIGAVIWIQVLKAAAQSRSQLSSSLQSQHRTKQELAWSEERLHFAQGVARMGTWDTDLATGEGIWSDSLRESWGIDATVKPTYENFVALVHPDDRLRVEEAVLPAERDGGDFEYEYRVCRPNGEVCWFLCRGRIVLGEDGGPARSLGVAMDITQRKRAEDDRAKLEQQLRQAQKLQAIGRLATTTTFYSRSAATASWRRTRSSAETTLRARSRRSSGSPTVPPSSRDSCWPSAASRCSAPRSST